MRMKYTERFLYSQCPNCGKQCITYWQKMKLVDYRFDHKCKLCGGYIKLPAWHIPLYLSEIFLMMFLIVKFELNKWESILLGVLFLLIISFIQLPFIPIKN